MEYEDLMQQVCGQVSFIIERVNQIPEPDRSTIMQRLVQTLNKKLDQSYKQFPDVEVVNE